MMGRLVGTVFLGLVCSISPVRARPIEDMKDWAQRLTQIASTDDYDGMVVLIKDAADSRLNIDAIRSTLQSVKALIGDKKAEYSEQFDEKSVGTFFKRINIAVKFPESILFYSVVLVRSTGGWEVIQFNVNGNVNKILDAPWPA